MARNSKKNRMPRQLVSQAVCAVVIDSTIRGTAWLATDKGHIITAAHIIGKSKPLSSIEVVFSDEVLRVARKIQWDYNRATGIDYAILQLDVMPRSRNPLPIAFSENYAGGFLTFGYGKTLRDKSPGVGFVIGDLSLQNFSGNKVFVLDSKQTGEEGFSGAPIYSESLKAVIAIQIESTTAEVGANRDTSLAMPMYRIANVWQQLTGQTPSQSNETLAMGMGFVMGSFPKDDHRTPVMINGVAAESATDMTTTGEVSDEDLIDLDRDDIDVNDDIDQEDSDVDTNDDIDVDDGDGSGNDESSFEDVIDDYDELDF